MFVLLRKGCRESYVKFSECDRQEEFSRKKAQGHALQRVAFEASYGFLVFCGRKVWNIDLNSYPFEQWQGTAPFALETLSFVLMLLQSKS